MRYVSAEKLHQDDFGDFFTMKVGEVVYDAATKYGPWATMTEKSWKLNGIGKLGTGFGQKYVRNEKGELHKVEG
ncbi:MAG: hypothetical protein Unbinned200contig1000_63 [Prokaryotic dsDNA virus sp.]|nr:MAG: hypothetical protein Unbinned200contig1000_63 [Prokaryotic dsDNA virus sp.]